MKIKITIGSSRSRFSFSLKKDHPVANMKAKEVETGKTIKITESDEGDSIKYRLEFSSSKQKGFQFLVEFDRMNEVTEENNVYYFDWGAAGTHRDMAVVILPKSYELLYTNHLNPIEVSTRSGCISATFERPYPESEAFRLEVVFSKKGIELIEEGDNKFHLGHYDEAKCKLISIHIHQEQETHMIKICCI